MYHFSLLGSETLKLCFHRRSDEKKKKERTRFLNETLN